MPTMLAPSRPHVWSQNTSYVGAIGVHSENSYSSIARNFCMDNQLLDKMEIINKMHQKNLKQYDRNKRKLEQSITAYTEKLKHVNKERLSKSISRRLKDIPEVDSAKSSLLSPEGQGCGKSDESLKTSMISNSPSGILYRPMRHLSPIKVKRPERKMTFNGHNNLAAMEHMKARLRGHSFSGVRPDLQFDRVRRKGTVAPPDIDKLLVVVSDDRDIIVKEDRNGQIQIERKLPSGFTILPDIGGPSNPLRSAVTITPFPEVEEDDTESTASTTRSAAASALSLSPRFRSKKSKSKKNKRSKEAAGDGYVDDEMDEESWGDSSSDDYYFPRSKKDSDSPDRDSDKDRGSPEKDSAYARLIEIHKLHMKEQERLAMEHKKRLEEEKKNRQHVTESFRYSVAMEELMDDDKVKKVTATKHTVSRIEKSDDGREIRIMGPAVLTSVNKADIEEIIHKRRTRRFTTAIMKERNPTLMRVRARNSVASFHPQRPNGGDKDTNQERRMKNYRRQISSRLILPTITETDRRAHRINIKAMS